MAAKKKLPPSAKIAGTDDAWENGKLGQSAAYAERAALSADDVDDKLDMQLISIRLPKSLIEDFKLIADYHGNSYQPLMRQILKRFAAAELKIILRAVITKEKGKGRVGGTDSVRAARSKAA